MPRGVAEAGRALHLTGCRPQRLAAVMWVLGWLVSACSATPAHTPAPVSLHVAATDLAGPLLADLAQAYAAAQPQMLLLAATTPLSTIAGDLTAGRADLALTATYSPDQFATPLAYVVWVVVVNPANPLSQLSAVQVRDIFAGRTTDWAQVGGAPGAIQVVCREDHSDGAEVFSGLALEGAPPTLNALVAPNWAAMRAAVSQNPNAIGYLPGPELEAGVRPVNLERPLRALIAVVAPQSPAGAARDFLAWAQSAAGQAIVAQRYEAVK
jgi:ABC-type phosphate transport system substrate-binding protein